MKLPFMSIMLLTKKGQAYILYTKDILIKENVIHLPIYMAMFL